jgi:hypothetical protein
MTFQFRSIAEWPGWHAAAADLRGFLSHLDFDPSNPVDAALATENNRYRHASPIPWRGILQSIGVYVLHTKFGQNPYVIY